MEKCALPEFVVGMEKSEPSRPPSKSVSDADVVGAAAVVAVVAAVSPLVLAAPVPPKRSSLLLISKTGIFSRRAVLMVPYLANRVENSTPLCWRSI